MNKVGNRQDFSYYKYLTFDDLKNIAKTYNNVNLVAIKAPQGTKFEVPDTQYTKDIFQKTVALRICLQISILTAK